MKKILIIIDSKTSTEEKAELAELKKKIGRRAKLCFLKETNAVRALEEVCDNFVGPNDDNVLVLYTGSTVTAIFDKLTCRRLDMTHFLQKLKEAVVGEHNKYNKELICTLYAAGITALIKS